MRPPLVYNPGTLELFLQDPALFLKRATHEIPTKTVSEIEEHEQWYAEYCTLLSSKKKAIEDWKTQKQVRYPRVPCTCILQATTHMHFMQHGKVDAKTHIGHEGGLLITKRQHKKEELYAKEREKRFAKLSAWKVSYLCIVPLIQYLSGRSWKANTGIGRLILEPA